jgi:hypothetical protein
MRPYFTSDTISLVVDCKDSDLSRFGGSPQVLVTWSSLGFSEFILGMNNPLRLPPRWKSRFRRTRNSICVYADSSD